MQTRHRRQIPHSPISQRRAKRWRPLVLSVLTLLLLTLMATTATLAADEHPAQSGQDDHVLHLPLLANGSAGANVFAPIQNTTLDGGDHTFDGVVIPAGVTVTVLGDVFLDVTGNATVAGSLIADCHAIEVVARGGLTVTGTVDNRCQDGDVPGDLRLHTQGGSLVLGGDGENGEPATIETDGELDLANDPETPLWFYDLLPEERSQTPLPPACSASSDVVWDSALPEDGATIRFSGDALDPDGGPVQYEWEFGDGAPTATGADVTHTYTTTGIVTVTLTVRDDEDERCTATLQLILDDGDNLPESPGLSMAPVDLALPVDSDFLFDVNALDVQTETLSAAWTFGDGSGSDVLTATHSYTTEGRYEIALTVTDPDGNAATATAAVYVYSPPARAAAAARAQAANFCTQNPPPNFRINVRQRGRNGKNTIVRGQGNVLIRGALAAGDGEDGEDRSGVGFVRGGHGEKGGSLVIGVRGTVSLCAGATLRAGDGGDGGDATATAPPGQIANARGGRGGAAGGRLRIVATQGVFFEGATTVDPGSGGGGGNAEATGDDGADQCTRAGRGARAQARGGDGGRASKSVIVRGNVLGLNNVTVTGGQGGFGGNATANGGDGGNATCPTTAEGGDGRDARAYGGRGGNAKLNGAANAGFALAANAFQAGDGGNAIANGGFGGTATATGLQCGDATATGGAGGEAYARGGNGGRGRINGSGGDGEAYGGRGGDANATGGDCVDCGDGGAAAATAGDGGDARASDGRPAAPVFSRAEAGDGGTAMATGGRGGDCETCPGGEGGTGGTAAANGGDGGRASGNVPTRQGGDAGAGNATGGEGGTGADCCGPPNAGGGNGGPGGEATSRSGQAGAPGGQVNDNGVKGGDGGDGGDGEGPGNGGPGGDGDDNAWPKPLVDGIAGVDGEQCPAQPRPEPKKQSDKDVVAPGETIHYTIDVPAHPDLQDVSDGFIADPLSDILIFVGEPACSLPGQCQYDEATHTVGWSGALAPGDVAQLSFTVQVADLASSQCPPVVQNQANFFDGAEQGDVVNEVQLDCSETSN